MSEKKVVHYHKRHHHHTPEEIMQAFTYQGQGKTIRETARKCFRSGDKAVTFWNAHLFAGRNAPDTAYNHREAETPEISRTNPSERKEAAWISRT